MAKYRKKPVVIEAEQFLLGRPLPDGLEKFQYCSTGQGDWCKIHSLAHLADGFRVQTLEGPLAVSPGDWIITGVKGERYPCKPGIFDLTYERVEKESNESRRD